MPISYFKEKVDNWSQQDTMDKNRIIGDLRREVTSSGDGKGKAGVAGLAGVVLAGFGGVMYRTTPWAWILIALGVLLTLGAVLMFFYYRSETKEYQALLDRVA